MKSRQIRELFMEANLIPETVQNRPGSAIREGVPRGGFRTLGGPPHGNYGKHPIRLFRATNR